MPSVSHVCSKLELQSWKNLFLHWLQSPTKSLKSCSDIGSLTHSTNVHSCLLSAHVLSKALGTNEPKKPGNCLIECNAE